MWLRIYHQTGPVNQRLFGFFALNSFLFLFWLNTTSHSLFLLSLITIVAFSPRLLATIFLRQNYNFIPLVVFSIFAVVVSSNLHLNTVSLTIFSFALLFSCLCSITTCVISLVLFPIFLFSGNESYLTLATIVFGSLILWFLRSLFSLESTASILAIIGFTKPKNNTSYSRPFAFTRALALNFSQLAVLLYIIFNQHVTIDTPIFITLVLFLILSFLNESNLIRFIDTHTLEYTSHVLFIFVPLYCFNATIADGFALCAFFVLNPIPYLVSVQSHLSSNSTVSSGPRSYTYNSLSKL